MKTGIYMPPIKNPPANAGASGSIPGLGRFPGGGLGKPLQYSCLENPHGQRSLAGYSPWGHKEVDTTEVTEHAHAHRKSVEGGKELGRACIAVINFGHHRSW